MKSYSYELRMHLFELIVFNLIITGSLSERDITVLKNTIHPSEPFEVRYSKFIRVLKLSYDCLAIVLLSFVLNFNSLIFVESWWCQIVEHKCGKQ